MPHPLSPLGLAHTLLSLPPVIAGVASFIRHRRIDPATRWGQVYLAGLALSVVTSFGLSSVQGVNPGHVLGVLALLAAFAGAWLLPRWRALGRLQPHLQSHLQNFGLSFSFFMLLVPGLNETLTRLPAGAPLATGPDDPVVRGALLAWLLLFVVGFVLQTRAQRRRG
ncbi:hypothetical protein [Roseateles sp. BYS87W]|uniref:DUF2306 domain-containing protein n=1 Tax=Pelomonas baiyunensis TaxID=3299026 RepID=A0ABW7H213_9BURK